VVLNNNTVELYSLHVALKEAESRCLRKISSQGHHSEVRAVTFSSDNLAIVSASAESVKMWNR
jgi:U3 small nucleolar RNA-associated protein 12